MTIADGIFYAIITHNDFRNSIIMIISDKSPSDEDLVVNTFKMLASAAYYQPDFLVAIVDLKDSTTDVSLGSLGPKGENLLDTLGVYIKKSSELIESNPKILLNALDFLMALWQGASRFINIENRFPHQGYNNIE
ncbi:hypothetical protein Tco_0603967 [Tanacetum coccineum]